LKVTFVLVSSLEFQVKVGVIKRTSHRICNTCRDSSD